MFQGIIYVLNFMFHGGNTIKKMSTMPSNKLSVKVEDSKLYFYNPQDLTNDAVILTFHRTLRIPDEEVVGMVTFRVEVGFCWAFIDSICGDMLNVGKEGGGVIIFTGGGIAGEDGGKRDDFFQTL